MSRERKETSVEVKVVDLSQILSEKRIADWDTLKTIYEYGYVDTKRGTYFLSNEGYGDSQPMGTKPVEIEVYGEKKTEGGKNFSMISVAILKMSIEELRQIPYMSVPLNNFIRKFGSRLESNYEEWREALEEAS